MMSGIEVTFLGSINENFSRSMKKEIAGERDMQLQIKQRGRHMKTDETNTPQRLATYWRRWTQRFIYR